jgi:hypothetical protein
MIKYNLHVYMLRANFIGDDFLLSLMLPPNFCIHVYKTEAI